MNSLYDELDKRYDSAFGLESDTVGPSTRRPDYSRGRSDIAEQINKCEQAMNNIRIKSNESVHNFWESKQTEFGLEIYEIANVIFAVPPTQATVERSFSALKFLFSDSRYL